MEEGPQVERPCWVWPLGGSGLLLLEDEEDDEDNDGGEMVVFVAVTFLEYRNSRFGKSWDCCCGCSAFGRARVDWRRVDCRRSTASTERTLDERALGDCMLTTDVGR